MSDKTKTTTDTTGEVKTDTSSKDIVIGPQAVVIKNSQEFPVDKTVLKDSIK